MLKMAHCPLWMNPVPVQVVVAMLVMVRPERFLVVPLMFRAPVAAMVVVPVPLMVPPLQVVVPVTVRLLEPSGCRLIT